MIFFHAMLLPFKYSPMKVPINFNLILTQAEVISIRCPGSHCKGRYKIPSPTFVFCTSQMQEFRSQRARERHSETGRRRRIPNNSLERD